MAIVAVGAIMTVKGPAMPDDSYAGRRRSFSVPLILIGLAAFAAFLILNGHGYHLLSVAPFLIFLACPLMHIFHHGHGHGRHQPDGAANLQPTPGDDHQMS